MRIAVIGGVVALALVSCRGTTSYVSGVGLATVTSADPNSAPCNDVEQQGREIDLVGSRAAPPAPAGGVIQDGTYVLTSSVLHTKDSPPGAKLVGMGRTTIRVQGATSYLVQTGVDGTERRTTVTRTSSGTVSTAQTMCPSASSSGSVKSTSTGYTATPTSFAFINPGPAGTVVATYTKL
jgi:hypothetical protein